MHSNVTNVLETPSSLSPSPSNSSSTNASSVNNYGPLTEPSCASYFPNTNVNHGQSHQQLSMITPPNMTNSSNIPMSLTNSSLTNGFNVYSGQVNTIPSQQNLITSNSDYTPSINNSVLNTETKMTNASQSIERSNSNNLPSI